MDDLKFLLAYGILAGVLFASIRKTLHDHRSDNIPIVGSSGFLSSYRDAFKFMHHAAELTQRGYDQYPDGIFRIARLFRWEYVVTGPRLIKDIAGAPEHIISFAEGVAEASENHYHQQAIRTTLTRNLHACFPDVRDEIISAFDEVLQLESEWKSVTVLPAMMDIVARVSNRLFVGLPLCRNKAYLSNNVEYTINVMRSAAIIGLFPPFLRPLIGPIVSGTSRSFQAAMKFLGPILEERLKKEEELGPDWPGKPNDLISWMLEIAEGEQRTVNPLALRILSTNMAAIHTTSMAFTHALFDLTTHPEYFLPMREEAERVIKEEGWTKAALSNMVKIDSFFRESQRINTLGPLGMPRRVVAKEGFRFSDGTVLPEGSYLSIAVLATHKDDYIYRLTPAPAPSVSPAKYENATTFDGFRFSRERTEHMEHHDPGSNQDIFKRQMISTAVDHLPFGTGKHACPGRFFAATELKAMMAHLVINYDVEAEAKGVRPPDRVFGAMISPNEAGKVRFRRRQYIVRES
ncbi:cytochrome P450 [Favolaschia claudopus]|uniref:Cytochrome P450 n=1 Tax=Favolaschia claudopus TaxID=2862362 RepID=A0AAW0EIF4_9AGAR